MQRNMVLIKYCNLCPFSISGECVHSVRRSNTYQNVIPISVPQQECGFGPEHVGQNWVGISEKNMQIFRKYCGFF